MLEEVGPGLWTAPVRHRVFGIDPRRQMIVARLAGGGLWVHSPPIPTPENRDALTALGVVRHVVGPSLWHDECMAEFQSAHPEAIFHATPGLAGRCRDVRFACELGDSSHADWAGDLEQHLVRGMPRMNEVVFFHRAARALILADLAINVGPPASFVTRCLFGLAGAWNRFTPTRYCRSLIEDRSALQASVERILGWEFECIVVGHGRNLPRGGRASFREAFGFLF